MTMWLINKLIDPQYNFSSLPYSQQAIKSFVLQIIHYNTSFICFKLVI